MRQKKGEAPIYSFVSDKNYDEVLIPLMQQGKTKSAALRKIFNVGFAAVKAMGIINYMQPSLFEEIEEQTTITAVVQTKKKRNRIIKGHIPQDGCRYYTTEIGNPVYLSFPHDFAKDIEGQGFLFWKVIKLQEGIFALYFNKEQGDDGWSIIRFNKRRGGEMRIQDSKNLLSQCLGEPKREGEIWTMKKMLHSIDRVTGYLLYKSDIELNK